MNRSTSLSITNSQSLLKLMPNESVMPSSHLSSLSLLPPLIRVFSNESTLHMSWPKYWSFSFSISPSNEHPGLISFRMDWLDLLAVQGTLKSLLQHHSSEASVTLNYLQIRWHSGKESACQCRRQEMRVQSGLRRSPGVGNGNPLHCSCPETSMDIGDSWATVHGITKSGTQLSMHVSLISTIDCEG